MAEEKNMKRYRGTMKYLDKEGIGYIVPDLELFVSPSYLSSKSIKEGDRVEFGIQFRDSNPQFEAVDVVPLKTPCFKCRKSGHATKRCRKRFPISRVRCFRCGFIGHFAWNCSRNAKPSSSQSSVGPTLSSVGPTLSSVVCVKERVDVKRVEEVEDCFILEFDLTEKDGNSEGGDKGKKENCDVMRSIVCVKNVEDVKKVEEVEDCFILEFDPCDEPLKFGNLSICDDDEEDVFILEDKGQVACRDYPHPRHLCATYPFKTTPHEIHCKMCFCFVCEMPAPCKIWSEGVANPVMKHCDASTGFPLWSSLKELRKQRIKGQIQE